MIADVLPPLDAYLAAGREHGLRWTALRREVLELLWRDARPRSAYALTDEMKMAGRDIFPNSLYRVLNLLEAAGLVVPIASSRRVQISPDPRQRDWGVLQCSRCEQSRLLPIAPVATAIREAAKRHGHATEQLVIECVGLCRACGRRG